MALSDPQNVTHATVAYPLARTYASGYEATYGANDGTVQVRVKHRFGKRNQHRIEFVFTKVAADPITAVNRKVSNTVAVQMDELPQGFTAAEALEQWKTTLATLSASSYALPVKIIGSES